jgi:hypothetical protein
MDYLPSPCRLPHIFQNVGSCSSSSAGVICEVGLPFHHGCVEEQAATRSKALNHIQNVSFLKVKPAIRQAQNKFSLMLSIISLILKMAAAEGLALVCLLRSDHKEASHVPHYLLNPAIISGPAEIVCMIST